MERKTFVQAVKEATSIRGRISTRSSTDEDQWDGYIYNNIKAMRFSGTTLLSNTGFRTSYQTLNSMVGMKDCKHERFIIKHAFSKTHGLHNIISTAVTSFVDFFFV